MSAVCFFNFEGKTKKKEIESNKLTLSGARWPLADDRHFLAGGLGGSAVVLLPAVTMRASAGRAGLLARLLTCAGVTGVTVTGGV